MPELKDVVVFQEPPREPAVEGDPQPRKPTRTHRTYERINTPGGTRKGKEDALTQVLMGGKVQDAEAAAIGRSAV